MQTQRFAKVDFAFVILALTTSVFIGLGNNGKAVFNTK
jgi:hypothetical protein